MVIVNPNADDVTLTASLTDNVGTTSDPVTLTIPAGGQITQTLADSPISLATGTQRTIDFSVTEPVFVTALRYFTNERSDTLLTPIPIADVVTSDSPIVLPHFADGFGWKTQVVLVNTTDEEVVGEVHFVSPGTLTDPVQPVVVGTDGGDDSVFVYDIQPRSFFVMQTNGLMPDLSTGSVRVVAYPGYHTPAAHVVVANFVADLAASDAAGILQGNTIFQASIEGVKPASTLRFYVEANGDFGGAKPKSTRTSIAIANPLGVPVNVVLKVTSFDNVDLGVSAPITIPADGQFGAFLGQIPGLENLPTPFKGVLTLTVPSGDAVTGTTFRFLYNERPDLLVTTTGPLNENAGMAGQLIFPYITDSTGYTTQLILVDPPGTTGSTGVVRYKAADGTPLQIDVMRLGSIQVLPFGGFNTPSVHVLMQHRDSGVLTTIVGQEAELPAGSFRMYAESRGEFETGVAGSTRTGVALANPSDAPSTVVLEVRSLDGVLVDTSAPFQVPASGQVALFLNSVPGFENLPVPFEGVLSVSAKSPQGVTATTFRASNNERGNVLFTTTGPLFENAGTRDELVFGHIAEGGGYTTQFVVIGGVTGKGNAGVLRFFNEDGNPLNLTLETR
jgi:hypothetical protein